MHRRGTPVSPCPTLRRAGAGASPWTTATAAPRRSWARPRAGPPPTAARAAGRCAPVCSADPHGHRKLKLWFSVQPVRKRVGSLVRSNADGAVDFLRGDLRAASRLPPPLQQPCGYDGGTHGLLSTNPAVSPVTANWSKVYVGYGDGGRCAAVPQLHEWAWMFRGGVSAAESVPRSRKPLHTR
jgi:hypothetical protein